jgi:hypothetical protein
MPKSNWPICGRSCALFSVSGFPLNFRKMQGNVTLLAYFSLSVSPCTIPLTDVLCLSS